MRQNELARGAKLVKRHVPLAVLFAPTWIAGVYHVTWRAFLPWAVMEAALSTQLTVPSPGMVAISILAGSASIGALALCGYSLRTGPAPPPAA